MSRGACPNPNRAGCPWTERKGGCFSDLHHIYWPASDYKTPTEKQFRQLPENKEQTCRFEHDEAHAERPPVKPSIQEMKDAISGIAIQEWDDDAA